MEKNTNAKFIGVLVVCVVLLLIFEIFFYDKFLIEDESTKLAKQQLEQMKSVNVDAEQQEIYSVVNSLIAMMNNKEYEKLYSLLKEDYKEYLYPQYSSFERYISNYASYEYVPNYTSYYRNGNRYIVILEYLKKEYTREDLINNVVKKYDIITIEKLGQNDYRFALGNFIETTKYNKSVNVEGLEFAIMRTTRYAEKIQVKVMVKNNTDESIYISDKNVGVDMSLGNTSLLSYLPVTLIKPGDSLITDFEYYLKYDSNKELTSISLSDISSESEKSFDTITIEL